MFATSHSGHIGKRIRRRVMFRFERTRRHMRRNYYIGQVRQIVIAFDRFNFGDVQTCAEDLTISEERV